MTQSIFDPEGGQTEHSGSRNLGPSADNNSHMPPEIVDGKVSEDQEVEFQAALPAYLESEQPARMAPPPPPALGRPPVPPA